MIAGPYAFDTIGLENFFLNLIHRGNALPNKDNDSPSTHSSAGQLILTLKCPTGVICRPVTAVLAAPQLNAWRGVESRKRPLFMAFYGDSNQL